MKKVYSYFMTHLFANILYLSPLSMLDNFFMLSLSSAEFLFKSYLLKSPRFTFILCNSLDPDHVLQTVCKGYLQTTKSLVGM